MASRTRGTAVVVLGAAGLTLILADLVGGVVPNTIRSVSADALAPVQTVAGAMALPVVNWVEDTGSFTDRAERVQMWQQQAPQVAQVRGMQRVADLDKLLGLVNAAQLTVVPARVIAYPTLNLDVSNVLIDTGTEDGVGADQAVINGLGLIGRTATAGPGTTEVKLLSAKDSAVGGRILRTGQPCVVLGTGDPNELSVRVLDPTTDIQINDAVITFGSKDGRPFPPDLPIGLVTSISDDGGGGRLIKLKPAANLAALNLVGVVQSQAARAARGTITGSAPAADTGTAAAAPTDPSAAVAPAAAPAGGAQ